MLQLPPHGSSLKPPLPWFTLSSSWGVFYAVDPIMSLFMSKEFSVPKSFSSLIMNQITNVFTSHDQTVSEWPFSLLTYLMCLPVGSGEISTCIQPCYIHCPLNSVRAKLSLAYPAWAPNVQRWHGCDRESFCSPALLVVPVNLGCICLWPLFYTSLSR